MSEPVFLDASAWIALGNRHDQWHSEAKFLYEEMKLEEIQVTTSTWTIYEALTVIKGRVGYTAAEELWKVICDPELVFLIKVTEDVEAEALWLFFNYRYKVWGIVDCANLIIMEKLGCRQALAFDRHFEEAANQRGFVVRRA